MQDMQYQSHEAIKSRHDMENESLVAELELAKGIIEKFKKRDYLKLDAELEAASTELHDIKAAHGERQRNLPGVGFTS